ncbi:MAG: hypothetical protein ACTSVV_02670 [Promethearchaeota archaeon]
MAKKKKEVCPYCGRSFAYLSRHKCKIKEKVEGSEDLKTDSERLIERIEETKKTLTRKLKKDEKEILEIIKQKGELLFEDLLELTGKPINELEEILDVLQLQSKIKVRRELINASWTKHIFALEDLDDVKITEQKIDTSKKDFVWDLFGRQPCFICPVSEKCNETNLDQFNPYYCPWLSEWIECMLMGIEYNINFDELKEEFDEY